MNYTTYYINTYTNHTTDEIFKALKGMGSSVRVAATLVQSDELYAKIRVEGTMKSFEYFTNLLQENTYLSYSLDSTGY